MRFCPECRSVYTAHISFCGIDGSNLVETEQDLLIGCEIDRYLVIDRIGIGATGCVYRVKHTMLEQEHAMKILYGDLGQDQRIMERFKREAKAISMIRHPNVLSVTDFGRTPAGLTFLVMELVHGVTLDDEIFAGAPFSIRRIVRILEQVASGLGDAHRLGFIHRDVKPMNIMLRPSQGLEHVTILDFGIVGLRTEALDARLTATGFLIGTPAYMAPEQACDPSGVTPAADFYSLGVILYEMLTGKLPFNATQPVDMIVQHSIQPVPEIAPAGGLETLCEWMLEKRPQDRPQNAQQIIEELQRIERELRADEETPELGTSEDFPLLEPVTYVGVEERLQNIKKTLSEASRSMRPDIGHTFDARLAELVAQSRPGRLSYLYRDLEAKIAELERALSVYG